MKVYYKNNQVSTPIETDYENVINKTKINNVELTGDKSTEELKVTWFGTQTEFDNLTEISQSTIYIVDDGVPAGEDSDYLDYANKPLIDGVEIIYNKISSDFDLMTKDDVDNQIASMRSVKVVSELPAAPLANTLYYVGPDSENIYWVYLFDSFLTKIELGPSSEKIYTAGKAINIDSSTKVVSVGVDNDTIKTNASNKLELVKLKLLDMVHPVGSIFMTTTLSTATAVGNAIGGTWVDWGVGRAPLGINTSDSDFNTVEKTGGEPKHKLTVQEMPSHKHNVNTHYEGGPYYSWAANEVVQQTYTWGAQTGSTGGDTPHNNLQPYITCYMYKRTA